MRGGGDELDSEAMAGANPKAALHRGMIIIFYSLHICHNKPWRTGQERRQEELGVSVKEQRPGSLGPLRPALGDQHRARDERMKERRPMLRSDISGLIEVFNGRRGAQREPKN